VTELPAMDYEEISDVGRSARARAYVDDGDGPVLRRTADDVTVNHLSTSTSGRDVDTTLYSKVIRRCLPPARHALQLCSCRRFCWIKLACSL